MIVATQAFILAAAQAGVPLTHPRIGYHNLLSNLLASAISSSGETATGPADHTTRPNTDEYWEPPTMPASITYDLGSAQLVNYVAIGGANFGTCRTAVKVELGNDPAFSADATFAEEVMPDDDAAMMFLDASDLGRYLRIGLTGAAVPRVPVVYAGRVLEMEKAVSGPYRPISMARKTKFNGRKSSGGQFLGQSFRSHGLESDASFRNLSAAWVRANFNAFSLHARGLPYFFAWNPGELPREVAYCWQAEGDDDIVPVHNGNGTDMDVSWRMVGLGHE